MSQSTRAIGNPYPGLRPFREDEEHLFFGRESQVDTMIDKLAATRFLAVIGASGSGKSSLVNCGLRPALHRGQLAKAGTTWRIAQFRPGRYPVQALARALAAEGVLFTGYRPEGLKLEDIVEATLRMSNLGLVDTYEQAQPESQVNLLVVADQFEELFRYRNLGAGKSGQDTGRWEEAMAFVNLLIAAAQSEFPIHVVLTMRSDFLGDCAQFPGLPEAINAGQYLVPRLTREERRAAIAGPAAVGGAGISPVLLTRVLNDVGDNPDQLSILQHALNRTWAYWQHQCKCTGELTLDHYKEIGTMAHALDQHADKAFKELKEERKKIICQKVFKALTDKGTDPRGIRRPTSLMTLAAIAGATEAEVVDVVDVFRKPSRSFLMPPLPERPDSETAIDISHESLMRVWVALAKWADEEAESSRRYRRLADAAEQHAKGEADLLRDPGLQRTLNWRRQENPTAEWADLYGGGFAPAMAYLEESKEVRDKEVAELEFERRWRIPRAILVGIFFVAHETLESFRLASPSLVEGVQKVLWDPLVNAVIAIYDFIPWVVAYLLAAGMAKRLLRRYLFDAVVKEVGAATVPESAPVDARFGRRLAAGVIDWAVFIIWLIASFVGVLAWEDSLELDKPARIFFPALVLGDWLYQAVLISRFQATLGKQLLSLRVTDADGNTLSFRRASARYLAKTLMGVPTLGLIHLAMLFTPRHQALHDLAARTLVRHKPRIKHISLRI